MFGSNLACDDFLLRPHQYKIARPHLTPVNMSGGQEDLFRILWMLDAEMIPRPLMEVLHDG